MTHDGPDRRDPPQTIAPGVAPDLPGNAASRERLHFAAIVRSSDDAIVSKTLDGTILSWNPAAERIFGYTAEEMIGSSVFRIVPPELHDEERTILARIRAGSHVAHYETERVHRDGRRIIVSLTISPLRDTDGTLIGASSIKRDITEQRALEARMRQVQRLESLGRLAGGIAHDFNNILTVIQGLAGFLGREVGPGSRGYADLQGIRQAVERASNLTRQLLAFSRQQPMRPERIDFPALVRDTLDMLRRVLGGHVRLETHLSPGPAFVVADRGQLVQVLLNLVVNARDAMPEGGTLSVGTYVDAPASRVRLTVRDTGVGMDAETRARVFEPFFTTKPRGQGTGLGLATVYRIVSDAGGTIEVDSEIGVGSVFRVALPLAEAPAIATEASVPPAMAGGGTETVLVVDDEPEIAALAARALESHGYTVVRADGPGAALIAFAERAAEIDLLLTDVVMPVVSGPALAERMREQAPDLPVLFMSGFADRLLPADASGAPPPLLSKPFTPEELVRAVRAVLDAAAAAPADAPRALRRLS